MESITSSFFRELDLRAQTAYAQLYEATLAAEHVRSVADLTGSFNAKTVKGVTYWYYQYTEPSGKQLQVYVGPDNEAVRALRQRKRGPSAREALGPLARAAAALGCAEITSKHARVLARLGEYGFFKAGGVLIGTHAFIAYGNMLGLRWRESDRTEDVDFAHAGRSLSIALPTNLEMNANDAIDSLDMGFLPATGLAGEQIGTYLNPREPTFRLDFLTPLSRPRAKPARHPRLGVHMQPLPFIEYSLENVKQAALFYGDIVVLANVPDPARYALHKLIVYGERGGEYRTKGAKDLQQAAALLSFLCRHHRADVGQAWGDLISRGKGWRARVQVGLDALDDRYPELNASALFARTAVGARRIRVSTRR